MLCQVESLGIRQVCLMASNMVPCTSISVHQEMLVQHTDTSGNVAVQA